MIPTDALLTEWPSARLTSSAAARVRQGAEVGPADLLEPVEPVGPGDLVRLVGPDSRLLAVGRPAGRPRFLRPVVVVG